MLFEIAILQKPTKKEMEEEGKTEQLIFGPKAFVAKDPQGAVVAAMQSSEVPKVDPNKVEVLVRFFVSSPNQQ